MEREDVAAASWWTELAVHGAVLYDGIVLKRSEVLRRWNERWLRIVRVDAGVLGIYWIDQAAAAEALADLDSASQTIGVAQARGVLDLSKALVEEDREEAELKVKHVCDLMRSEDCFGSRSNLELFLKLTHDKREQLGRLVDAIEGTGEPVAISASSGPKDAATERDNLVHFSKEKPVSPKSRELSESRLEIDFDVLGELGKGAFSIVYRAKQRATGREVAIKVALLDKMSNREKRTQLRYLESEVNIMQKVSKNLPDFPNVVRLLESFAESKPAARVCMVLELCNGGELFDRIIEKGFYSEKEAKIVMVKLTKALQALHEIGVVHRDIKPENLIYASRDPSAEIKITDFGLALDLDRKEKDVYRSHIVGTSGYYAPEVLVLRYSPLCDVWSLGVVMYILLSGYPPFAGKTRLSVQKQIREGKYRFHKEEWKNISESSQDLISKMLKVDPKQRISTREILTHPWITQEDLPERIFSVDRLKKFNNKRKLKGAVYAVLWSARLRSQRKDQLEQLANGLSLTTEELSRIRNSFERHTGENHVIETCSQLREIMAELGYSNLPIERLFEVFDTNDDGVVDQRELLSGLAMLHGPDENALKFCFDIYDKDGSGDIDKDELFEILSACNTKRIDPIKAADDLAEAFDEMDSDSDGTISFEEFKQACKQKPYLVECFLPK